jgi:hypothetical protein
MEINGVFKYSDDHRVEYINGAFGSVNNHGEVVVNFFFDHTIRPETFQIVVDPGQIPFDKFPQTVSIDRNVVSTVIMSPETAKVIVEWMKTVVQQAEAMREGK